MQDGRQTDSRQSSHAPPEAPFADAGHFLERGLVVRSGCGAQGAAHAPRPVACGLGSPRSRGNPHGQDARGTLARAARGIARPLTPTLPPQRGGREKARPSASPRVPSPPAKGERKPGHRPRPGFPRPLPRGRGRVRGRARSGRATGSRDPRLSPGPRRPDGKARAVATATVLGRMPVAPWRAPRAGHFLPERGLPVRGGCGAQGAAPAPAHWQAGLEARGPENARFAQPMPDGAAVYG